MKEVNIIIFIWSSAAGLGPQAERRNQVRRQREHGVDHAVAGAAPPPPLLLLRAHRRRGGGAAVEVPEKGEAGHPEERVEHVRHVARSVRHAAVLTVLALEDEIT
eukprot:CAMPEP_0206366980 /NCGR_PEP_ID=MMETSP0294-20121207/3776_1 /ASSEMBLY_ACC=CAM_ASM_000327 /TAXON_ID=39354 /ORGANISM="Heterosigma akashiwo, Strain CCMP2393" /LENGTH=104 /DNA_ID=CAMNT_0053813151 /DNA_START=151 /DNA_END=466 /DNA_ORIENTATION=+